MRRLHAASGGTAVRGPPAAEHALGARPQIGVDVVDVRNDVGIAGESLHYRISIDPALEDHRAELVEVDRAINEGRSEGRPCAVRSVTMGADRLIAPVPFVERRDRRRGGLLCRYADDLLPDSSAVPGRRRAPTRSPNVSVLSFIFCSIADEALVPARNILGTRL